MFLRQRNTPGLFIASGVLFAAVCAAQQERVAKSSVDQLLKQLHSARWADRAAAYEKLSSDSKALSDPRVQKELLNLLGMEIGFIPTKPGDPEPDDIPDEQDEAFAEYLGYLGGTVDSFANWNDPSQVCLFVHEGYDPDSRFAAEIAAHGKIALPCLMQTYADVALLRSEVAPVIVQALAKTPGLDEKTIQAAKGLILKALRDPEEADRINTVEALKNFGGEDMIAALKQIAQSDTAAPAANGDSIRKWATEAIAAIEKRAAAK
ncbi:MAG: HEAT repeat domain-containing protein [Bryobacterales bacterium]|nr:HEAT repeat domain-containing protein [Bryobacterales bacterium]